jgi:hypothetical protein
LHAHPRDRVAEDQLSVFGPAEQRPQDGQRVLTAACVEGDEVADDVVAGDLAQVLVALPPVRRAGSTVRR